MFLLFWKCPIGANLKISIPFPVYPRELCQCSCKEGWPLIFVTGTEPQSRQGLVAWTFHILHIFPLIYYPSFGYSFFFSVLICKMGIVLFFKGFLVFLIQLGCLGHILVWDIHMGFHYYQWQNKPCRVKLWSLKFACEICRTLEVLYGLEFYVSHEQIWDGEALNCPLESIIDCVDTSRRSSLFPFATPSHDLL